MRRHARSVAQDVVMTDRRSGDVANSGGLAGSPVRHETKTLDATLRHADNAESE